MSTNNAGRHLLQLCKSFGHKVPVEFTPESGKVAYPFGIYTLSAEGASLILVVEGDTAGLDRLEQVVGDHLARFAFREKLTSFLAPVHLKCLDTARSKKCWIARKRAIQGTQVE